jgi:hypothetical protein
VILVAVILSIARGALRSCGASCAKARRREPYRTTTFRNARIDDRIVVDTKSGIPASTLRRSA